MNEYSTIILGVGVVGVLLLPTHLSHRAGQFTYRSALLTVSAGRQGWAVNVPGVRWLQRALLAALDWLGDASLPVARRWLHRAGPVHMTVDIPGKKFLPHLERGVLHSRILRVSP